MGSEAYNDHCHPTLSPMPVLVEGVEAFLQSQYYSSISSSYSFRRNTKSCCLQCIHSALPPIIPMYLPYSHLLVSSICCKPCCRNVSPHDSIPMCYIFSFPSSLYELGGLLSWRFFLVSFPSLLSNLGGYILSLITLFPDFMAIFYHCICVHQTWYFNQIKYGFVLVLGDPQFDMTGTIQSCHIFVKEVAYLLPVFISSPKRKTLGFCIMVWTSSAVYCNYYGHHQPTWLVFSLWVQE